MSFAIEPRIQDFQAFINKIPVQAVNAGNVDKGGTMTQINLMYIHDPNMLKGNTIGNGTISIHSLTTDQFSMKHKFLAITLRKVAKYYQLTSSKH